MNLHTVTAWNIRSNEEDMYKYGGRPRIHLDEVLLHNDNGYLTLMHEVGHALETQDQDLFLDSMGFLYSRTKNEKLQQFSGGSYAPWEKFRDGKFIRDYVGKEYAMESTHILDYSKSVISPWQGAARGGGDYIYATEVVSVGLEEMFRDPLGFALKDPEHFSFIYEKVLRRYAPAVAEKTEEEAVRAIKEIVQSVPLEMYGSRDRLAAFSKWRWGDQIAERVRGDVFDSLDSPLLLRGIGNEDFISDNINGDWFGRGAFGNGNYFAGPKDIDTPIKFAKASDDSGWVYAAKLKPDAKIIKYEDLLDEWENALRVDFLSGDGDNWREFFESQGDYAAFKGYDAIHVDHFDYYVVLNQRATVVDERMLPGGQFDTRTINLSDMQRLKTSTVRRYESEINERWDEIMQVSKLYPDDQETIRLLQTDLEDTQNKASRAISAIEKRIKAEKISHQNSISIIVEDYINR